MAGSLLFPQGCPTSQLPRFDYEKAALQLIYEISAPRYVELPQASVVFCWATVVQV